MLGYMDSTNITDFGATKQGEKVRLIILKPNISDQDDRKVDKFEAEILTYGATVRSIRVPGLGAESIDIALGCNNIEDYENSQIYMGCVVGRVANRIKNGRLILSSKEYQLNVNNGPNHLHGGKKGFNRHVWRISACGKDFITLRHQSDDGDEGYPGRVNVEVTYKVSTDISEVFHLTSTIRATCSKTTTVNLANHIYFNLSGENSGYDGLKLHEIQSNCTKYLPVDDDHLITGEIKFVDKTDYDLTQPSNLGLLVDRLKRKQGYAFDNYFCECSKTASPDSRLRSLFKANSTATGLRMEVKTTHPGLQFYTADYLDEEPSKEKGRFYGARSAFCVEAQGYPDAVNHPKFPSIILNPGETYNETVQYTFFVRKQ